MIQSIFDYKYAERNCLTASFGLINHYVNEHKKLPDSSIKMVTEFETLVFHLIQLARQNNLDINRVLNFTSETGDSLLHMAAMFSEKITIELISQNVMVNRINNEFVTPLFMVRLLYLVFDKVKFPSTSQLMIDKGANPHIIAYHGYAKSASNDLTKLKNVPTIKSVFYSIKDFNESNLGDPWCYTTGVYDGKFARLIGKGGEGTVILGEFDSRPAAYKFVKVKNQKYGARYEDHLKDMKERLKEMTDQIEAEGDSIFYLDAHYRQDNISE